VENGVSLNTGKVNYRTRYQEFFKQITGTGNRVSLNKLAVAYLLGSVVLGPPEHVGSADTLTAQLMHLDHLPKGDQA
jgi:hypothetical protein